MKGEKFLLAMMTKPIILLTANAPSILGIGHDRSSLWL